MKDRLYIATFSEGAIETANQYGLEIELNDLCISENLDEEKIENTIQTMNEELTAAGSCDPIVHGPFTEIIPASIDHRAVAMGFGRLEEAYQACKRMGLSRMVVHSGYMPLLYFKDWHLQKSVDFWSKYMENKPKDFLIYIENVFEDEPLMLRQLIEAIDDPRVRLCLDVGHAHAVNTSEYDIAHWIRILGPYIGHFHLHNNDGTDDQHRGVCDGTMDMQSVLRAISEFCPCDVTMTIESRTCFESVRWMLEYFREIV